MDLVHVAVGGGGGLLRNAAALTRAQIGRVPVPPVVLGVRLLIVSDLEEKLRHPVTQFEDDGFRFIGLREEPLENPFNRGIKRTIDFVFAVPIMLMSSPGFNSRSYSSLGQFSARSMYFRFSVLTARV